MRDIVAEALSPGRMLSPPVELRVPPYQRGFSWTLKEAGDLLEDLLAARSDDRPHFLGAVVVVGGRGRSQGEVLDGQQRLTTLTILLAVLRDLEESEAEAERLHRLIGHEERTTRGRFRRWRFSLGHTDMMFFREVVQDRDATIRDPMPPGASPARRAMLEIVEAFQAQLAGMSLADRRALATFVAENCTLVRVGVADRVGGFDVFRVLNTRGLHLSGHDILKTELLERAGMDPEEAVSQGVIWDDYGRRLGPRGFDDLLSHIRMIHDPAMRGPLLQGYREQVLKKVPPRRFFNQVLPRYVSAFALLRDRRSHDCAASLDPAIRARFGFLRALEHRGWMAPLLKFLADEPGRAELQRFVTPFECLAHFLQLVPVDREIRVRRYRRLIRVMDRRDELFDPDGPLFLSAGEKEALLRRVKGRISSGRQRRALALRVNAALRGGETIAPEAGLTLEHVLPRTVAQGSAWLTLWSDDSDRRELTDCIGNFALLPLERNQRADRADFDGKRKIYFARGQQVPALTRDIRRIREWGPSQVRERRDRLAARLAEVWSLHAETAPRHVPASRQAHTPSTT